VIGLHAGHSGPVVWSLIPPIAVLALAAAYVLLAGQRGREPRGWSAWRTASFLTGCGLLLAAVLPSSPSAGGLRGHMTLHLLIGMYAPIGLVLGAPVTLLLRSVSTSARRRIGCVLKSRLLHLIANPVTALALNLGGVAALYFTPLYTVTTLSPILHVVVSSHFLAAGCLFAWVIAGPDPAPRRPSVPMRLVVLGVAITGHAVLAQLLYAGAFVVIPATRDELRAAGDLMYYGGDIAELLLALALVTTWRPRRTLDSKSVNPRRVLPSHQLPDPASVVGRELLRGHQAAEHCRQGTPKLQGTQVVELG
jgi:putative membrane protein